MQSSIVHAVLFGVWCCGMVAWWRLQQVVSGVAPCGAMSMRGTQSHMVSMPCYAVCRGSTAVAVRACVSYAMVVVCGYVRGGGTRVVGLTVVSNSSQLLVYSWDAVRWPCTTVCGGSLGSCVDEECSQLCELV